MEPYKDQLFEVDYLAIKDIFEHNFGRGITSIQYERTNKKVGMPGICGEYIIPQFAITFNERTTKTITLFARKQLDCKESKQSHHYKYLSELGVPVPKLYGTRSDSQGCEILIMDYAQEIVDETSFFSDEKNLKDFIDLAARLSCVTLPLEYLALIGRDMGSKNDTRDWKTWMPWSIYILDKIWDLASGNKLNDDLKELCSSNRIKIDLQTIALALIKKINSLEVGIAHGDFRPNNMVLLTTNNQLGLIDFEDVILDTKYYDIARYLGAPGSLFKWDNRHRDEYVDYFIERNNYYGGNKLIPSEFKTELFHIWYARTINLWEWLPHEYGGPSYDFIPAGRNREERCKNIYKHLKGLIESRNEIVYAKST